MSQDTQLDLRLNDPAGYFTALAEVAHKLPLHDIRAVGDAIFAAYRNQATIYLIGNGGSAALASHHACDLGKGTVCDGKPRLRVVALTDNVPLITALANDLSYDQVFVEQLKSLLNPGDITFAISCSGNSPNVIKALQYSKQIGATTIGLTGYAGGKMPALCDMCVIVPSDNMQIIEDLHVSITHSVFTTIRHRISLPARARVAIAAD